MKSNQLLVFGFVVSVMNFSAMEQREGIAKLKEASGNSSVIAQKCADNFTQECAVFDAMFKHEKERRLSLGKQITEDVAQNVDNVPGFVVRNRLRSSYLRGCKTFFVYLSEQESEKLEEALDELLKNATNETIEKELNYIRSALR